jgi:RNA polymerase sigma factor (sigma-70 family)
MPRGQLLSVLGHLRRLIGPAADAGVTDRQLLGQFAARHEEEAFAQLVQRHGPMVLDVCRRVLRHGHDAEDAFQATFLILAQKAGSVSWHESAAGWLYEVARRVARNARRADARRRNAERRLADLCAIEDRPEQGEEEGPLELHEELGRLPEKYRVPLVLCYLEGRSHAQVARQLGWPLGTVKGRLARALERLRRRLAGRGVALPAAALGAALAEGAGAAAVPAALADATVQVATLVAAGQAVAGATSAPVAALVQGVLRGMVTSKLKVVPALVLVMGLLGAGAGLAALGAWPPQPGLAQPSRSPAVGAGGPNAEGPARARTDRLGDPLPPGAIVRLGTVRFRPGGNFNALAFLPGGKALLSTGLHGIRFWDAATGKELRRLEAPGGGTWCCTLSPDGKVLAASCYDRTVRVWETDTGKELRRLEGSATDLAFSHDSRTLVVGDHDRTLHFWNWRDGTEGVRIRTPLWRFDGMAFGRDDRTFSAWDSRSLVSWEVGSGRERHRFKRPGDDLTYLDGLAVSADGKLLATSSYRRPVRLYETATGRELRTFEAGAVQVRAFAPDANRLLLYHRDPRRLELWDVAGGQEVYRIPGDAHVCTFSPDGRSLAVGGGWEGAIRLYDAGTGRRLDGAAGHESSADRLAFSPDGRLLASRSFSDHTVRLWGARTGAPLHVLGRPENYGYTLGFSPDGKEVVWGDWEGRVHFADPRTGRESRTWVVDETVKTIDALGFAPDGRTLATISSKPSNPGEGRPALFGVWDVAGGKPLSRHPRSSGSGSELPCISPDGRTVVLAEGQGLKLRDVARGRELVTLRGSTHNTLCFAFPPDGKTVAAVTYDNVVRGNSSSWENWTLRLWEVVTGREVLTIPTKDSLVGSMAFSGDGRFLASGCAEAIRVWDVGTGEEVLRLRGHRARVHSLCFAPDGRTLASGLSDSTVLVWDVAPLTRRAGVSAREVGPKELEGWWADLAGPGGPKVQRALWSLAAVPDQSIPLLRGRLRPAPASQRQRIERLIADLDSDDFAVRQRASRELERSAAEAEPALLRALARGPSAEVRRRVEALLELPRGASPPEGLRLLRAVQVLEQVASAEARQVLRDLAQGEPDAPVTAEARAALQRLARREGRR